MFCRSNFDDINELQHHQLNCDVIENSDEMEAFSCDDTQLHLIEYHVSENAASPVSKALQVHDDSNPLPTTSKTSKSKSIALDSTNVIIEVNDATNPEEFREQIPVIKKGDVDPSSQSIVKKIVPELPLLDVDSFSVDGSCPTPQTTDHSVYLDYTLDRQVALNKKKKGCDKPLYHVKHHNDSTYIALNTASFDTFKDVAGEYFKNQQDTYKLVPSVQKDQQNSTTQDVIRVLNNNPDNSLAFTINLYRTKNSALVNGPSHTEFRDQILPLIINKIDLCSNQIATRNITMKRTLSHLSTPLRKSSSRTAKKKKSHSPLKSYPSRSRIPPKPKSTSPISRSANVATVYASSNKTVYELTHNMNKIEHIINIYKS